MIVAMECASASPSMAGTQMRRYARAKLSLVAGAGKTLEYVTEL
ncbi:hypothetical protein [Rhodovarius lipocyclicus]|nr:hypothetical protein [Rhodovarius lipocyclicus]